MTRNPLGRALSIVGAAALVAGALVSAGRGAAAAPAGAGITSTVASTTAPTAVSSTAGSRTAIGGWSIQSTAKVSSSDAAVATAGFSTSGWYAVPPRSTVFAGLLANGVYPDPAYSTRMKSVDRSQFTVPWWYRSDFTLSSTSTATIVDFSGVISSADIWVNGAQVASHSTVAGVYPRYRYDLSSIVHTGTNTLAVKVYPNDPGHNLTTGWIDWNQTPPDNNMGLWRDVVLHRLHAVELSGPHVLTALNSSLTHSDVTVKVDAHNTTASAVHTTISGTFGVSADVDLAAHQTKTVTFSSVGVDAPKVWWPVGMGSHPLYDLDLTASVSGATSDTAHTRFGIRDVKAPVNSDGDRYYVINGKRVLIQGGGWSPDLFLRTDLHAIEDRIRATVDLGLNTIRLEGHLEDDGFFDLADSYGVMTLPGWECCNKWQDTGSWSSADHTVARASMASEAARLRTHASVISFLVGSDQNPGGSVEQDYVDALHAADWPTPIVSSAAKRGPSGGAAGPSGMKMNGPYEWIPPNYWYTKQAGGAYGFASEISAGPDIPTTDTLDRMLSSTDKSNLWQNPTTSQYHAGSSSDLDDLHIFDAAMNARYGAPTSYTDYVRKAQLANYEATRAQYEAYARNFNDSSLPSTGNIYWMLNSGWTSLHWQLIDEYLDQAGSYYGVKKADEPLHVQYSYDDGSIVVVNKTTASVSGLTVSAKVYNLDGTLLYSTTKTGSVSASGNGGTTKVTTLPSSISGRNTTYLVRLRLSDSSGTTVSRNTYWLSTKSDAVDYTKTNYAYSPATAYADLKGLTSMPTAALTVSAATTASGSTSTTTVTVKNTSSKTPALYMDVHLRGTDGAPVLPVSWSDNALSLWPGESQTVKVTYRTSDLHGATPSITVAGWNTGTKTATAASTTACTVMSQGRSATASSTESSTLGADKAFDGSSSTRWASAEGVDPQWLRVDLGSARSLSRITLTWEAAFAKAYRLEISADGTTWTTVSSTSTGDGGTDTVDVSGTGRYVRMYGTARSTSYGYSLYEMSVC
jgi:exo-1,4-beta-D-glucosaminidase